MYLTPSSLQPALVVDQLRRELGICARASRVENRARVPRSTSFSPQRIGQQGGFSLPFRLKAPRGGFMHVAQAVAARRHQSFVAFCT
jgi:hypothetical protein